MDRDDNVDEILSTVGRLPQLENFVWIINERALTSNSSALFDGLPVCLRLELGLELCAGLLGVKLHDVFNEENLLLDARQLVINAFTRLLNYPPLFWSEEVTAIACSSTEPWSYGADVYR